MSLEIQWPGNWSTRSGSPGWPRTRRSRLRRPPRIIESCHVRPSNWEARMPGRAMLLALACLRARLPPRQRYPVTGIVLKVDLPHRTFVASCAAIPGYMEAMAMQYSVRTKGTRQPAARRIGRVHAGSGEKRFVSWKASSRIDLKAWSRSSCARAVCNSRIPRRLAAPGQAVEDFALTDQTGQRVALSQSQEGGGRHLYLYELSAARTIASAFPTISDGLQTLRR